MAVQLSHAARILVYLHRPLLGGLNEYMQQQKDITKCVEAICGIAKRLDDDAAAIMCSQCLYIGKSLSLVHQPAFAKKSIKRVCACKMLNNAR